MRNLFTYIASFVVVSIGLLGHVSAGAFEEKRFFWMLRCRDSRRSTTAEGRFRS